MVGAGPRGSVAGAGRLLVVSIGWQLATAVVCAVAWRTNGQPGVRHVALSVLAVAVSAVLLAAAWRQLLSTPLVTLLILGVCGVAVWLAVSVVPNEAVGERVRGAQPRLTVTMQRFIAQAHSGCFRPAGPDADIEPVGRVDELCVQAKGGRGTVSFTAGPSHKGLIYDPVDARPHVMDQCILHVYGPWWEISGFEDSRCPSGLEGVGGG